jgi:CRP-like cAMP-binding protein
VYGPARDIEWAIADGQLYLLQCRAVTRAAGTGSGVSSSTTSTPPADALESVPLFADLHEREMEQIMRLFKERRFAAGETVVKEGSGGAAFYLIDSGEAKVSIAGKERGMLKQGDYFGEISLIDKGARTATVTASTDLVCFGLTYWDFRPLVQQNAGIAWNLLRSLAKRLRDAEHG